MPVILSDIDRVVGCGYDYINNMVRLGLFTTELPATSPGRARAFTFENALEVAFRFYASKAGLRAVDLDAAVREWLRIAAGRQTMKTRFVAINSATGAHVDFSDGNLGYIDLAVALSDDTPGGYSDRVKPNEETILPVALTIIDRVEIADRLRVLFKAAA